MNRISFLYIFLALTIFCVSCSPNDNDGLRANHDGYSLIVDEATDTLAYNPAYAIVLADSAIQNTQDSLTIYRAHMIKAGVAFQCNPSDSILLQINNILAFCARAENSDKLRILRALTLNMKGGFYQRIGNLDSSIFYFKKALVENVASYDKNRYVDILINIGDSYLTQCDYVNSSQYFHRALFVCDSIKSDSRLGFPIYFGLGQLYLALHDFTASDYFFSRAEKEYSSRPLGEKLVFANNRGNYYYYNKEYRKALPWFRETKLLGETNGYDFFVNLAELNMSDIFLQLGEIDSSDYYVNHCEPFF